MMPPLAEVALLFLKLGFTAFGGPAAHIGIMHDEVVKRRKWLTDEGFLDLLGATNLIPGPNSTEMAIHIGYLRAGLPGLIAAGLGFVLPAALIVLGLSWLYVRFGAMPQVEWLMYGVKPVVIAIISQALWNLGNKAFKNRLLGIVGVTVFILYFFKANEIVLLFAGGLVVMLIAKWRHLTKPSPLFLFPLGGIGLAQFTIPFSLPILFLTFLKIGSVLYGSGYVLLAFLRNDFVLRLGWLTDRQLLDAIAIGQITPGPLFTSATFIGYILGGTPGALLATLGIFLPSFIFVLMSNPLIPKIRNSVWAGSLLDGVNASSLGLMAGVTCQLAFSSLTDFYTAFIGTVSLVLLLRYKINSTWLIAGGALAGYLIQFIR
ncbi:MAG: chromate efflux transporter [Chloroflexi bacterium]|nr:chromate efflux transporter [Chloroflexota bacterium]